MYKQSAKTIRLVIGIISIVLCLIILLQSCAVGVGNAVLENGESGGSGGFILSISMLVSGIMSIAARKTKGGIITSIVFYIVGSIIAFINAGSYSDLYIWAVIGLIFAVLLIISLFMKESKD